MNVEAKLLRLMGKRESNFFVNDCGTHYSNLHLGICNEINRLKIGILSSNLLGSLIITKSELFFLQSRESSWGFPSTL